MISESSLMALQSDNSSDTLCFLDGSNSKSITASQLQCIKLGIDSETSNQFFEKMEDSGEVTSSEESDANEVLIVALLGILPLVPRNLSNKAFRLSLLGTALSSFYSLYTLYHTPRAWNLSAVHAWFQSIIATKDFIHLMYCLMLVSSRLHLKLALIPVICWSVEHVAKFLRGNFSRSLFYRRYLEQPCLFVEANSTTLSIVSSNSEIALGFLLVISVISWQRSIFQTFMYWQLLKLMYHAPATAGYHKNIWAKIGQTANPYIYRYAPFLNTPISVIQRWWFR
ncbi:hypothetical protein M5K25_024170 [Dendrobium thyrsiflorum]|uniref:Uncharacterized protein n=1 Tax=Dendrobium thyrsiflorum TaxID=117978 RepID=A0ABD0U1E9_DENTH